jgi:hypothetical protein
MVVAPALGVGVLVVLVMAFFAGCVIAYAGLSMIARIIRRLSNGRYDLTESSIYGWLAILGGVILVVALIILYFNTPRESLSGLWTALIVIGILFGLFTIVVSVLMSEQRSNAKTRSQYRPPTSSGLPPTQEHTYQSPTIIRLPPPQENTYRPPSSTAASPSVQEDFYRVLLAKARYDKGLADRLIEVEREHSPYASFDDLCRSAIAHLERDNR